MSHSQDPRFVMLVKLLQLTTSDSDGEALAAMRKANAIVRQHFGGDWESLLKAQVKIIADPFFNVEPFQRHEAHNARGSVPAKPKKYRGLEDLA